MFPVLHLGPLVLQAPGLFLLLGVWVGLNMAGKRAQASGLQPGALDNLIMAILSGFLIGGRLVFIAANFSTFQNSPLDIFSLNYELFDPSGGLASGLIVGGVYGQRNGFSLWPTLDALTPFLATLAVAIHIAHLAGGLAYGEPSSLPWAIELRGATRHPSQVYESLGALMILLTVALRKPYSISGMMFLLFVSASAGMSLFLQAFRGDGAVTASGVRVAQITAWIILAASLALLDRRLQPPIPQAESPNPSLDQ